MCDGVNGCTRDTCIRTLVCYNTQLETSLSL